MEMEIKKEEFKKLPILANPLGSVEDMKIKTKDGAIMDFDYLIIVYRAITPEELAKKLAEISRRQDGDTLLKGYR